MLNSFLLKECETREGREDDDWDDEGNAVPVFLQVYKNSKLYIYLII
jgi:hypothetical protein